MEAEEKPKGTEKKKHKVLSAEQPGQGKQREEMLPDSPRKSCEQNFTYLIWQVFFLIAEDLGRLFNNLFEILAYSIRSNRNPVPGLGAFL